MTATPNFFCLIQTIYAHHFLLTPCFKFSLLKKFLTFALRIGSICLVLSGLGLDSGSHSEAPFFYSKICCLSGFHPRLHAYSNTYKSSLRFFCRLQWDRNLSKDEFHNFLYVTKDQLPYSREH